MLRKDFNRNWRIKRDESNMMEALTGTAEQEHSIDLPHDEMIMQPREAKNPSGNSGGFYPGGNYTYLKNFPVPKEDEGKRILLEFEGAYRETMVYLNEEYVTSNKNGYTGFYADLTDHIHYGGENRLKVRVMNGSMPCSRWYTGTGIYRPVHLLIGEEVHVDCDGLRILTPEVSEELATVETEIRVKSRVTARRKILIKTQILDHETIAAEEYTEAHVYPGKDMAARQRVYVRNAKLWSPDHPNLYRCVVQIFRFDEAAAGHCGQMLDETRETFGIRHIQVDPLHGFRLNSERVLLRGACIHHDNGPIGAEALKSAEVRKMRIMKEAGFNAIRSAHNPASRALLEACDEVGMLVMEETYDTWHESKSPYDYAADFEENWERDLESIVAKDFNHPCVIMYSVGNEIGEFNRPFGAAVHRKLCDKFRELDPTRYVTNAVNGLVSTMEYLPRVMSELGLIPEKKGEGEDINDIMTLMQGQMNQIGQHHLVDDILNESFSMLDICGYNYMYSRYETDKEKYPNRIYYGSETLAPDIPILWDYAKRIPQMIGDFTWTGWDYIGEAGIGVAKYNGPSGFFNPYPTYLAYCGDIDITGFRRPMSYYREIVFGLRKAPYIAVQSPVHFTDEVTATPWMFTDATENWNFAGQEGKPVRVEVYSDAAEVELYVNGKAIGRKAAGEQNRYKAVFETVYEPGILSAAAIREGRPAERFEIRTVDPKCGRFLQIDADKKELAADGMDLAYLAVTVCDKTGTVCTEYDRPIHITLEGGNEAARVEGFGSADPMSTENFFDEERTPYGGRLLAVIRARYQSGIARLRFSGEGLQDAVCEVRVGAEE